MSTGRVLPRRGTPAPRVPRAGDPRAVGVSTQAEPTSLKHTQKRRGDGVKGTYSHRINHQPKASNSHPPKTRQRNPRGLHTWPLQQVTGSSALPCHVQCLEAPSCPGSRSHGFVRNTTPALQPGGEAARPPLPFGSPPPVKSAGPGAEPRPRPQPGLLPRAPCSSCHRAWQRGKKPLPLSFRPQSSSQQETGLHAGQEPQSRPSRSGPGSEPCELHCLKN